MFGENEPTMENSEADLLILTQQRLITKFQIIANARW